MSRINLKRALRRACSNRDTNKVELARSMGFQKSYLSNIVDGKDTISVASLDAIADKLGYKLWELIQLGDA